MVHGSTNHGVGTGANSPPPAFVTTTVRDSYTRKEGSGVGFGLSTYYPFDSENEGYYFKKSYENDPNQGFAKEQIVESPTKHSVSNKGYDFKFC